MDRPVSLWPDVQPLPRRVPTLRLMSEIVAEVAAETGFSVAELKGYGRTKALCHARQLAFYRCREQRFSTGAPRHSTIQIGRFFGRDHSTIVHGVQATARRLAGE